MSLSYHYFQMRIPNIFVYVPSEDTSQPLLTSYLPDLDKSVRSGSCVLRSMPVNVYF